MITTKVRARGSAWTLKLFFTVLLFGCFSAEALRMQRVVLLAGGFGSCAWAGHPGELNMWSPLKDKLLEKYELSQERRSDVIVRVCFGLASSPVFMDILEHKKFENGTRFDKRFSSSGSIENLAELILTLRNHSQEFYPEDNPHFVFIGQSHGGDLVLELMNELQDQLLDYPSTLITVDPISMKDCGPASFVGGLIGDSPGCTRFPKKEATVMESIRSTAQEWIHFYQEDFPFLHSGPALQADESIQLDFSGMVGGPMGAHGLTEKDERIWKRIFEAL